jgi:uncharacterized membrane-anchored protein YitT (DUF2179 family)
MQQTTAFSKRMTLNSSSASWHSILMNTGLIAAGCIIYTIGMNSVLIPNHWIAGGIAGFAIILHYWSSSLDVGLAYFLLNLPLLIIGWFHVSRRFMWYTIFGMTFFSYTASRIQPPAVEIHDPILAVIFGGVICGAGGGLILSSIGSAGGFDVIGVYLNKRFGLRPGTVIFSANAVALLLCAYLFGLEMTLYSISFLFVSTKVVDLILTGFNTRKSLIIISEHSQKIAQQMLARQHRGVTFLKGEGAYNGEEREVIFTITTLTEVPKLKEMIFEIDPDAFVVVNDTLEVLGKHHGKLKVY